MAGDLSKLIKDYEVQTLAALRSVGANTRQFENEGRFRHGGMPSEWRSNLFQMTDELKRLKLEEADAYRAVGGDEMIDTAQAIVDSMRRSDEAGLKRILKWAATRWGDFDLGVLEYPRLAELHEPLVLAMKALAKKYWGFEPPFHESVNPLSLRRTIRLLLGAFEGMTFGREHADRAEHERDRIVAEVGAVLNAFQRRDAATIRETFKPLIRKLERYR